MEKTVYRVIKEVKPKRRVGRDPAKVEAKRQRDLERAKAYYAEHPDKWELKQMARNDINIE